MVLPHIEQVVGWYLPPVYSVFGVLNTPDPHFGHWINPGTIFWPHTAHSLPSEAPFLAESSEGFFFGPNRRSLMPTFLLLSLLVMADNVPGVGEVAEGHLGIAANAVLCECCALSLSREATDSEAKQS